MTYVFYVLLSALAGMALLTTALVAWQGDCDIRLTSPASWVTEEEAADRLRIRFTSEFVNQGRQNGMIVDVWVRPEHLGTVMNGLTISSRVAAVNGAVRSDGYWEALILAKGRRCPFQMDLIFWGSPEVLAEVKLLPAIPLVFHYKTIGRSGLRVRLDETAIPLPAAALCAAPGIPQAKAPSSEVGSVVGSAAGLRYRCIPTCILKPGDDIVTAIRRFAGPHLAPGAVVAVSETALAVTQGRLRRPEHVSPGLLARLLCRLVDQSGSLSSPYALQMVMEEEGTFRVSVAFLLGGLSRILLRRRGDVYRLAGSQARLIDDVTGTLPPFDKHIVLGPARADEVVQRIRRELGVEAAVIDANDLGKVYIVACTSGVDRNKLEEVFRTNPWGNANEQTPLMVLEAGTGLQADSLAISPQPA